MAKADIDKKEALRKLESRLEARIRGAKNES